VGESGLAVKDYEPGLAMPAGETGTIGRSASILIQSGFNSRLAAIKAVNDSWRCSQLDANDASGCDRPEPWLY
jgi:hypothetical protein